MAVEVRWINGNKIHRGYEDSSGLFTLEQDHKDQAGPITVQDMTAVFEAPVGADFCKNCYPPKEGDTE